MIIVIILVLALFFIAGPLDAKWRHFLDGLIRKAVNSFKKEGDG